VEFLPDSGHANKAMIDRGHDLPITKQAEVHRNGTDEVRALVGTIGKLSRDMPGCVMSVLISSAPRALVDRCATRGRCGPPLDAPFPATLRPRRRMRAGARCNSS
jgi:hypothetical protein